MNKILMLTTHVLNKDVSAIGDILVKHFAKNDGAWSSIYKTF